MRDEQTKYQRLCVYGVWTTRGTGGSAGMPALTMSTAPSDGRFTLRVVNFAMQTFSDPLHVSMLTLYWPNWLVRNISSIKRVSRDTQIDFAELASTVGGL